MMLSQAVADRMARLAFATLGGLKKQVIYLARATAQAEVIEHAAIEASFQEYREDLVVWSSVLSDEGRVRRGDFLCYIPTAQVSWTPTHYDRMRDSDDITWRVLNWRDGRGRPCFVFHIRNVPGG